MPVTSVILLINYNLA